MGTNEVSIETISNGEPSGQVSAALLEQYGGTRINLSELRSLQVFPRNLWESFDNVLVETAKEELVGVADLNKRAQLTINFDAMSAGVYVRDLASEMEDATTGLTPDSRGYAEQLNLSTISVPLFVTYKDFLVNARYMAEAARVGLPLRTQQVVEATRAVSRALEYQLFRGQFTASGATAWGYTTFPERNLFTITSWLTETPANIVQQVVDMVGISVERKHFGPWILYLPYSYFAVMNKDYLVSSVYGAMTIRERILQIPRIEDIRFTYQLGAAVEEVVLVEMRSDTAQLINGLPLSVVDWEPAGSPNWTHLFKVLTITVPLLVADYNGNCGIVHGSVS